MNVLPGFRSFSLSPSRSSTGVSCDREGIFVGDVPLLTRSAGEWAVRPVPALNDELSACFQLPVDVTGKLGALALIAAAFNRGDLAMAAIATVQMQFPDPPSERQVVETDADVLRRAVELWHSGLLKAGWDPTQHPRTGTKPNPGWFATKPKPTSVPTVRPKVGWPQPSVNQKVREIFEFLKNLFTALGLKPTFRAALLDILIGCLLKTVEPVELNQGEDRLTAQLKAALLESPKTLEELHQKPTENILGYEQHHIVNQNPDNLQKDDTIVKFGSDTINDPDNIVWVPRLLHECINGKYSENSDGPGSPLVRDVINKIDFDHQYQEGLRIMRECGALQ
jgi:hypothetical protein